MKFVAVALFLMVMGRMAGPPGMALGALICVAVWLTYDEIHYAAVGRPAPPRRPLVSPSPPSYRSDSPSTSIRAAIPAELPIQRTLIELASEVSGLDETIRRARQQRLGGELTDRFQQR